MSLCCLNEKSCLSLPELLKVYGMSFVLLYKHFVTKLNTKGECTPCWLVDFNKKTIYAVKR